MMMAAPRVIVLAGFGINCEEETKFAFELAGAKADIVHTNDLISQPNKLLEYQILVFPGGFSFGDDTGSGRALANLLRNHLLEEIHNFRDRDTLILGICNGFQVLTNLGLLKGTLVHNDGARFITRWVDLEVSTKSLWFTDIEKISLPIAHGEGKYYADAQTLSEIGSSSTLIRYVSGNICKTEQLIANPNGSLMDIAGLTSPDGRILGLMPHPERAIFLHHLPYWTRLKAAYRKLHKTLPDYAPGLTLFQNAVKYFNGETRTDEDRELLLKQ